jgi:RNA polymerase sigma factor (sigma-70 family)
MTTQLATVLTSYPLNSVATFECTDLGWGMAPLLPKAVMQPPPPPSEKDNFSDLLVRVGTDKDRAAFAKIFAHFAPRVKSFLMKARLSPDQAEELAQDTMLTVWDKAAGFNPQLAAASTWIFTIARNKRIDYLRRNLKPALTADDLYPEQYDVSIGRGLEDAQDRSRVRAALKALPPEQAELITRSFFHDQAHGDISTATQLPLGTVKSRIRLALEKLRKELSPNDHGF